MEDYQRETFTMQYRPSPEDELFVAAVNEDDVETEEIKDKASFSYFMSIPAIRWNLIIMTICWLGCVYTY